MSQDEQLGYIRGKVESIQAEISEFKTEVRDTIAGHTAKEEERLANLEEQLAAIVLAVDIQANTHKYIWLTIKSVAGAIAIAISIKLGDITALFK